MTMNFEGKNKKSEQQIEFPENKSEKELSISEIKELVKEREGIFDSLDKFSKDEIFKNVDFHDKVEFKDKLNDEYDSIAYEKAGFWKKYENFTRFGFHKERYGLLKSKERGLLDKRKINEDSLGKEIEQNVKEFADSFDTKKSDSGKKLAEDLKKEDIKSIEEKFSKKRTLTKRYEAVDGEIVKIIKSERTESGAVEAAGKMRQTQISRLEMVNGADLIGLKESIEKNAESRKNLSKMMGVMSEEEKEKITAKLNEEERQTKEKIKEREEKIAEESKIFREPLEGRLKETMGVENNLIEAFDFIKTEESKLNNQIKEYENYIKEAQKLNLLGDVGGDIVKILEEKKAIADAKAKEFVETKTLVLSKLDVLKINKREIHKTLFRINDIGKTEGEKDKEIKETQDYYESKIKNKSETKTNPTENKKSGTESADTKKDKDDEHNNEYKFKKFFEFFERFKEKFPVQGEQITKLFDPSFSQEKLIEIADQINLREQPPKEGIYDDFYYEIGNRGRSLTVKYFENGRVTVSVHFEDILADKSDNREENKKTWDETRDEVWGLKNTIREKESQKGGKTFNELFHDHSYSGRKKEKTQDEEVKEGERKEQSEVKVEEEIEVEENEKVAEKVFTKEEIIKIAEKELKVLGIMSINDRTMREQITNNVIMAVEAMIAKSKKPLEEDVKKEVGDWYRKYSKNYFKKGKQPKI